MRLSGLITAFLVVFLIGCGKPEVERVKVKEKPPAESIVKKPSPKPVVAPKPAQKQFDGEEEELRRVVLDSSKKSAERKDALGKLLALKRSQADFIVEAYADFSLKPLIREVLTEAAERKDLNALFWAVALFESVGGEERIDFEVFLLRYGTEAVPYLVKIVSQTDDEALFGRAADGLAKIGDAAAVKPLVNRLDDPDTWIVIAAAHALGTIGESEALFPLMRLLKGENEVASAAAVALGKIGDRRAFDDLAEATTASDPDLRGHAAVALAQLGLKEAQKVIEPLLADQEPGVRFQAARALKILREEE